MGSVACLDALEKKQILFSCWKYGNETMTPQLNVPQPSKMDVVQYVVFRNLI
jgi:hypothetical protein